LSKISLLPTFEDEALHTLDEVVSLRLDSFNKSLDAISTFFFPDKCNKKILPFLAYQFGVDFELDSLTETQQRDLIYTSIGLHKKIGTPYAVKKILELLDVNSVEYPATIVEYKNREDFIYRQNYGGMVACNGKTQYNGGESTINFFIKDWFEFGIYLTKPINRAHEEVIKAFINIYKPARSKFVGFDFIVARPADGASLKYDSEVKYG